jgi:hypothetical protein
LKATPEPARKQPLTTPVEAAPAETQIATSIITAAPTDTTQANKVNNNAATEPAEVTCTAIMVYQHPYKFVPRVDHEEMCKASKGLDVCQASIKAAVAASSTVAASTITKAVAADAKPVQKAKAPVVQSSWPACTSATYNFYGLQWPLRAGKTIPTQPKQEVSLSD